jgi:hypothetical protein
VVRLLGGLSKAAQPNIRGMFCWSADQIERRWHLGQAMKQALAWHRLRR